VTPSDTSSLLSWLLGIVSFAGLSASATAWHYTRRSAKATAEATRAEVARAASASELARRNRELESLNAVAAAVAKGSEVRVLAEEILDVVRALTGMPMGAFYQLDPASSQLVMLAQRGLPDEIVQRFRVRPVDRSFVGDAMRSRRSRLVSFEASPPRDPELARLAERLGHRSQLTLPIMVKGDAWGVMSLLSSEPARVDEEEMRLLEAVMDQIGLAIDRGSLLGERQEKTRRLETLTQLAQTLTSTLSPQEVLETTIAATRTFLPQSAVRLWRVSGTTLAVAAEEGVTPSSSGAPGAITRLSFGEGLTGHVALHREPLTIEDLVADPRAATVDWLREQRFVSGAFIPLVARGRLLAVLAALTRARHRFTEDEVATLVSFANQAAIAMENADLFVEAEQRAAEYRALFEVGGLVSSTLEADRVLDVIAERCRAVMGVPAAGIFRLEPDGSLVYERGIGLSEDFVRSIRLRPGEGTTGRAAARRAPAWSADVLADPELSLSEDIRALVERERYRATLSVPILVKGELHGVIGAYWWEPHTPTPAEIDLMSALAGQTAIALENARLYQAASDRGRRLATLATLMGSLTSTLSIEEVLERVVQSAVDLFGSSVARLWLMEPDGQWLTLRASAGARAAREGRTRMRLHEGLVGEIAASRAPLVVSDLRDEARVLNLQRIHTEGARSYAGVPLLLGDRVLGTLSIALRETRPFSDEDLGLLQSLSGQAAIAIDNARLYAETTRRLDETRALLDLAGILGSTLEPRRLLRQAAIKIAQVCGVDRCTVERWDGGQVVPVMSQFADGRRDRGLWQSFLAAMPRYAPADIPAYARAIRTREPVVINDTADTDLIPRDWIETYSHRSYMVVPLVQQDQVIGVMNLDYCERPTPFSARQVDLARTIAGQLALSLENARLYGEVQQRLRETTTLVALGEALSRPGQSQEVMRQAARVVARAVGADMAGIYRLTPERDALEPIAGYRIPPHVVDTLMSRRFLLARFPSLMDAWRAGRAAWSSDVVNDPRFDRETFAGLGPHGVLFAPTSVRGEPVGGLFLVWWETGREFSPDEVRLVEAAAAQIGLAMENADLARQTQARLAETETLLAVSRTLASTLDLDATSRHFLRSIVQALDADTGGVWLLDDTGQWLEPLAGYRVPKPTLEALRRVRLSLAESPFHAEAARTLRAVVSMDGDQDPRIPRAIRDGIRHRASIFVPIVAKERMIGGFAVTWSRAPQRLSDGELRLAEAVASQAGAALENARLFRDNQRRVEELSVLHELSRAVTGRLDQAGLIATVHQQVARVLDVRHLTMLLHDEARAELEVALRVIDGRPDPGGARRYPAQGCGLMSVVLESGRPLRTTDYREECARRGIAPIAPGEQPHWLGVPMAAEDRILGVLALRSDTHAFTETEERLLVNIAALAALAFRSAQLFEERSRAYGELSAAQDQLVRTEKLRALGEMASGVAHDFNNVLASIVGRAQLLLREVADPRQRRWLEVIERSALDGAHTVRRLQEFTRIRRDQPFVVVDLNRVVHEALEATEPRWREDARRHGIVIEVTTSLTTPLPPVAGDPAELREALTNLILNALDAMPGGGRLTLATAPRHAEVELAVSDTGEGIPEPMRAKIFDPFFTTKGPRGTGLGLSMTYGILSRHRAHVAVESEVGHGTTFRLRFPITALAEAPSAEDPPTPDSRALRCLVVDDEEVVGDVMGDIIRSLGHSAEVVRGGADAIERFAAAPFDVVFTDLSMPGVTGWDVARAVRSASQETPVLLVTGFGVEVAPEELSSRGVDAVLGKPLRIQDVAGALDATARRRGGSGH
jgi:GAF domain-containing protein